MSDSTQIQVIKSQIENLDKRLDEDRREQREFNKSVSESLEGINRSLNQLEVFQSELNHTNRIVADQGVSIANNTKDISDIKNNQGRSEQVVSEMRWFKRTITGALVLMIMAAIWGQIAPDPQTEAIRQLTDAIQANQGGRNDTVQ